MTKCLVEMYGLSLKTTRLNQIEIEIPNPAKLGDIIAALRVKLPALEGDVILNGENRLTAYYTFNINGRFYSDESKLHDIFHFKDGQRIALLPLAYGG